MSAIHERQWAFERQQEIRARQCRETTETYLRRYEQTLNELASEGLEEYASEQFAHARSEINRIRHMSNVWDAREVSRVLGNFMYSLPREAREQRRITQEYQRLEAEREQQRLVAEKEAAWQAALATWQNKAARNLAFYALRDLKQQVLEQNFTAEQIADEMEKIQATFNAQAVEKQQKFTQSIQAEVEQVQKADLIKQIESANLPQSQSARLRQQLEQSNSENLAKTLQEVQVAQDKAVEDEAVRKEMVKAVYQSLKQAGFTVLNPIKQTDADGNDTVLVQAARPNGNQAKFRISLDGGVRYEFDNYKGQRCKEDMQQVLPKLSEIYGVNLSDERVIWENPDDELMDAKPIAPIHTRSAS